MDNLKNLFLVLQERSENINNNQEDLTDEQFVLFNRALDKTMEEIHYGAKSEDFKELTVINFIILSSKANYSTEDIRKFLDTLKSAESE